MDYQQIKAFIAAMADSDLDEMEVSHEGWTLRLVRRGAGSERRPLPAAPLPSTAARAELAPRREAAPARPTEVAAPLFGVVHLQQAPGDPPLVRAGQDVEAGQLLCVIEAMKVFNEVRAEQAGRIAAILVTTGQEVEAGQPLLRFA